MSKGKKRLFIGGGIVVVVAIIIANLMGGGNKGIHVQAQKVETLDITEEVSASGYIQPETRVNITSEVTAEIIGLPVKEGQTVTKGQLLIQLDTVQLQKDVDQLRYSLEEMEARTGAAKASFEQAELVYEREKKLYDRDHSSETLMENAEYSYLNNKYIYEAAKSQTQQTGAMYEKALDNLNKTRIVAPMSGVITYMDAEIGEIAPAQTAYTQGKTLMTLSNLSRFEVQVDVDETEINKVRFGHEAKIEVDAFPDTVFQGEVVEIGNTAVISGAGTTEQSTNFKVKVLFKDTDVPIRPGMSATVDIITNTRIDACAVPYGAIVMRSLDPDSLANADRHSDSSGGLVQSAHAAEQGPDSLTEKRHNGKEKEKKDVKGVFVIRDEKAVFVPVETGIADQKNIEVMTGITRDDIVITGPFRTLRTLESGATINYNLESEEEKSF
ncbi:MAG: efflux RND transporter periplasmic adaptor subunit [candidate division Zixibacteria bacterium]|nr:efflux RND transporter periplasmic adaptor subunit [candidate division Zixibacteria bacterium]